MAGNKNRSREILEEQQVLEEQHPQEAEDTLVPPEQMSTDVQEEPASAGEKTEENQLEVLMQQLEEQKRIAAENLDKALRVQAELDNMRKRTARDIENAHKYSLERFVNELLPVIDSMELGLSASENVGHITSLKEGMNLTHKMFVATLEKFGVRVVDPRGEKFNPELHQAVSMQETDGVDSGNVISVMQKGYELNGRLVRPAMVIVAK